MREAYGLTSMDLGRYLVVAIILQTAYSLKRDIDKW